MSESKLVPGSETISAIRTYQSVLIDGRQDTFFRTVDINSMRKGVDISFHETLPAVVIKSKNDHVIVPMANIACIYMWTDKDNAKLSEREQELSKVASPNAIKRPR